MILQQYKEYIWKCVYNKIYKQYCNLCLGPVKGRRKKLQSIFEKNCNYTIRQMKLDQYIEIKMLSPYDVVKDEFIIKASISIVENIYHFYVSFRFKDGITEEEKEKINRILKVILSH